MHAFTLNLLSYSSMAIVFSALAPMPLRWIAWWFTRQRIPYFRLFMPVALATMIATAATLAIGLVHGWITIGAYREPGDGIYFTLLVGSVGSAVWYAMGRGSNPRKARRVIVITFSGIALLYCIFLAIAALAIWSHGGSLEQ